MNYNPFPNLHPSFNVEVVAAGRYRVTREGKGDWVEFDATGGSVTCSWSDAPEVGIYLDDGPIADSDPYLAIKRPRRCECGCCEIEEWKFIHCATATEAVEHAGRLIF